jgi:hypothetical protein
MVTPDPGMSKAGTVEGAAEQWDQHNLCGRKESGRKVVWKRKIMFRSRSFKSTVQ